MKKRYLFKPQENISAYELAKLLPGIIPPVYFSLEEFYKELPEGCKRHIEVTEIQENEDQKRFLARLFG